MIDKIDLVYMWVDGKDPEWRKSKNHWLQEIQGKVIVNDDSVVDAVSNNVNIFYTMHSFIVLAKIHLCIAQMQLPNAFPRLIHHCFA